MKSLVLALMLVGLFAIVLGGVLYVQVKISNGPATVPKTTPIAATSTTATGTMFVPPTFHGPTAQPKIIGPSANPPNY